MRDVYWRKMGKHVFVSVVSDEIVCLICNKAVPGQEEYNLCHHYET
jgi:hypothetical protein